MAFNGTERAQLLALKGVGPTVIKRLETMDFHSLAELCEGDVDAILAAGAELTGSSCWKNSPQARASISAVLSYARQQQKAPQARE